MTITRCTRRKTYSFVMHAYCYQVGTVKQIFFPTSSYPSGTCCGGSQPATQLGVTVYRHRLGFAPRTGELLASREQTSRHPPTTTIYNSSTCQISIRPPAAVMFTMLTLECPKHAGKNFTPLPCRHDVFISLILCRNITSEHAR